MEVPYLLQGESFFNQETKIEMVQLEKNRSLLDEKEATWRLKVILEIWPEKSDKNTKRNHQYIRVTRNI